MRTFKTKRPHKEIVKVFRSYGWTVSTRKHRQGSDYIKVTFRVDHIRGTALVSTWNGKFFGELKDGTWFSSDETTHEEEPFFKALLEAIYTDEIPAAA